MAVTAPQVPDRVALPMPMIWGSLPVKSKISRSPSFVRQGIR